ncbi:glycosyltransferase [Pseudomonas protegens]|uniref:glycosyltransferase n=1 Tax=Pseudomonas protegens TaxID=380021 RepID=UPI0032090C0C
MNKKVVEALEYIKELEPNGAIFAIPFTIESKDVLALCDHPLCKGVVLRTPLPEITAGVTSEKFGFFENNSWQLPTVRAPVIFIGSQLMLTRQMAMQIVKSHRVSIICKNSGVYHRLSICRFFIWRAGEKLILSINKSSENNILRKIVAVAKKIPGLRTVWRRTFKREDLLLTKSGNEQSNNSGLTSDVLYQELLQRAVESVSRMDYTAIPRRVILVNAGLAAGGAERQIVNTLIGLKASGQCESIALLAEYIEYAPNLDFFLHELQIAKIEVSQVRHAISLSDDGLSSVTPEVAELLADIAPALIEEILNLVEEFRSRRPEVVHAWQDSSSIKAGIAAVIAGVPRIILASRNITPVNFSYYQDYMHPAYRALASLECVTFLNNSEAGAVDYTKWLELPKDRFVVVRNGVDLGYLKKSEAEAVQEYRQSLGIPESALVVGSIFRFWAEKRPMLWLQAAALLAGRYPDVHFLVIGEGPMRQEMESYINSNGLRGRVHLPGARPEVSTPLSAMNFFVLASEFEGTPNVVLEAQWLGLPIVSTDAGGARESFEHGVTGLLATNATAEDIAALVAKYLTSPIMRADSKKQGPIFVERKFGVARMIEETIKLYGFLPSELVLNSVTGSPAEKR